MMKTASLALALLVALTLAGCRSETTSATLSEAAITSGEVANASSSISLVLPGEPEVGETYEFRLRSTTGEEVSCDTLEGKVVLLDFWATWCGPCVGEMPHLKKLYDQYHDDGFEIVGLSFDKKFSALTSFVKENEIKWPQVYLDDVRKEVANTTGVTGIPRYFVLDRDHKLVTTQARGKLDAILPRLLGLN